MTQDEKDRLECLRLAVLLKTSKSTTEDPVATAERFWTWLTKDSPLHVTGPNGTVIPRGRLEELKQHYR